jgi:hypothetical protein
MMDWNRLSGSGVYHPGFVSVNDIHKCVRILRKCGGQIFTRFANPAFHGMFMTSGTLSIANCVFRLVLTSLFIFPNSESMISSFGNSW